MMRTNFDSRKSLLTQVTLNKRDCFSYNFMTFELKCSPFFLHASLCFNFLFLFPTFLLYFSHFLLTHMHEQNFYLRRHMTHLFQFVLLCSHFLQCHFIIGSLIRIVLELYAWLTVDWLYAFPYLISTRMHLVLMIQLPLPNSN